MNKTSIIFLKACVTVLFFTVTIFAAPSNTNACACCADHGTWFERTEIARDEANVLHKIMTADLLVSPAGLEEIKGISPAAERYKIAFAHPRYAGHGLVFSDASGNTGTLFLRASQTFVSFGVDDRDSRQKGNGAIALYKEWRFEGRAGGTGIFSSGTTEDMKYRLIFQGRGNVCSDKNDFKSWILQIKGKRADYSFYGSLENSAKGYFASPEDAVARITKLVQKEDWQDLGRYVDREDGRWGERDLFDSAFYLHEIKPESVHPAIPWKYKFPFPPGFKLDSVEDAPQFGVVRVILRLDIDEGGGLKQTSLAVLLLRKSDWGYQIIPPDPAPPLKPQLTGDLTRAKAAELAGISVDINQVHGFYCPAEQTWFFVRPQGSGVALRKRVSTVAAAGPGTSTGQEWKPEPFSGTNVCR